MPLADDIRALRDRTLGRLRAAFDYFTDSKAAWALTCEAIAAGRSYSHTCPVTGSSTSQADLLARSDDYISTNLSRATFLDFLAIFEAFFFDLLRLWLAAHPPAGRSQVGRTRRNPRRPGQGRRRPPRHR